MMLMISPDRRHEFEAQLEEMHKLRYRVFKRRLDWNVEGCDGKEIDDFDKAGPVYLIQRSDDGHIQGCIRMLPSTGPTMLSDVFPILLGTSPAPATPAIWESSRFALDLSPRDTKIIGGLTLATYELFLGMVEFGISKSLTDIVTVTDLRIERILRRAGWPLRRIHEPKIIGGTTAIAGYLEISLKILTVLRHASGISSPVLWQPVMSPVAEIAGTGGPGRDIPRDQFGEASAHEAERPGPE